MIHGICRSTALLVGTVSLITACEPASIMEARDQLRRGGERSVVYALPLIDTVFQIETLLEESDVDTLADGLLGVVIEPESVSVNLGEDLEFENIRLDTVAVSFLPGQLSVPPGSQITFSVAYDGLASDTILENVDTVEVHSGVLAVTTLNRLPIPMTYSATLHGFTQVGGAPLAGGGTIPAAMGNGSPGSDVLNFDLANVTVVPASVSISLEGSGTVGGTPIPHGLADSAIVQHGSIATLDIAAVAGPLDPEKTPELSFAVEEIEEIPEADLDLGDLEDAVEESTLNHAIISLAVDNNSGVYVLLSDFTLGVVKLDAAGGVPRDGFGDPVLEVDGAGNPITVPIADPGQANLTLPAAGTKYLNLEAAGLVDCLVHLLLSDERAAMVAVGNAAVGDGTQARLERTDSVGVEMTMTVGLDISIPATGVTFTRNTVQSGLELDSADADQLTDMLDSAGVVTEVINHTPFGVEVDIAFVEDSIGEDIDIFDYPGSVVLNTIAIDAPTVGTDGVVTEPSYSTVSISLTGTQARQLTGDELTATFRVRLLPGTGGSGRGAIRATDVISLLSQARIVLRAGVNQ